ncbi:MAG: hypothetical protein WB392_11685 [Methanotrichaceae archaeon]
MPGALSDSSTLIHMAKIWRLNLLKDFHEKIIVAPAVWKEVVEEGHDWPGSLEVEAGKGSGSLDSSHVIDDTYMLICLSIYRINI